MQDAMPIAMADYAQEQVNGLSHHEIADRLRRYPHPLLEAAADSIDYLDAQEDLLEKAQQAARRARAELEEHKRPLDAPMARLNQRVIELTAELDALQLKRGAPAIARHPTLAECEAAGKGPPTYIHGLPNTPEERARFEAYMRGHCWVVGSYVEAERSYDTVAVRRLYGVWRDRGSLPTIHGATAK